MTGAGERVAIVTGASQGIGKAVAVGFRREDYAVVGTSRSIARSDDPGLVTIQGDIAEPGTADRVVEQALERFGRIDCLVNGAGVYVGKSFTAYTPEDYAAVTRVNLDGFFHITQRAIAQMAEQRSGHVVNITTSLVEHASSTSPAALTSLTKGGLDAVTRALAMEYASRGVRVNAVALGVIRTPEHDDASYAGMAALHPLGRLGEVGDVVDAIRYLERATFVTGATLHVDGGQSAGH